MKKIVLILPTLPYYRLDFLTELQSALNGANMDLIILAGSNLDHKKIREIRETQLQIFKTKTIGFSIFHFQIQWQKSLFTKINSLKPYKVIMLYHAGKINYNLLLLYLIIKKTPYILWGSGYGDKRNELSKIQLKIKSKIKFLFLKFANTHITYGTSYAQYLNGKGIPKEKISIAQNTINIKKIIEEHASKKNQKEYNVIKFLYVGAINEKKNLNRAILAFNEVLKNSDNFRFDIVGDGNEIKNLIKIIKDLHLEEYIKLHGQKYDESLKNYFYNANVFILPGIGGLAINEAMAYGLPVISTPGDGTGYDLVLNNINGFLLDYNYTQETLISHINYFLNLDVEDFNNMEKESLRIITKKASLENMVNKFYTTIIR